MRKELLVWLLGVISLVTAVCFWFWVFGLLEGSLP